MEYKISVIVTYYNKPLGLLKLCLESIFKEISELDECIIVNDASSNTFELHEFLANQYPTVIVIDNNNNLGAGASKNIGVSYSSGEIIQFVDADDMLAVGAVAQIRSAFIKFPDTSVFVFNYTECIGDNRISRDLSGLFYQSETGERLVIDKAFSKWLILGSSPFSRRAWHANCCFIESPRGIDDIGFHLSVLRDGGIFRFLNFNCYIWNRSASEVSLNDNAVSKAKLFFLFRDLYFLHGGLIRSLIKFHYYVYILAAAWINDLRRRIS